MWNLHGMGEPKFDEMVYITWPSWPPCPYMVKTLKKTSSLEPKGRWPSKLVCSIGFSSTTKFDQKMSLGWLTCFMPRSNLFPYAFVWEKGKTMDFFSETVVVYYIKVGRCSQLNEYMKLSEYQRSRSFIDLNPNHSDSILLNFFSSITSDFYISSALRWAIQDQWSSGFFFDRQIASLRLPNTDAIGMVVCPDLDVLVAGCEKSCYAWDVKKLSVGKKDV